MTEILKQTVNSDEKSTAKLNSLLDILRSGDADSLASLESQLEKEAVTKNVLIKYLSLLRSFNEPTYDFIRQEFPSDSKPSISFVELTRNFQIESVPRSTTHFRVREEFRIKYLKEWHEWLADSEQRKSRKPFFDSLVEHIKEKDCFSEVDLLDLLILFDASKAFQKFTDLYDTADAAFDLASCHEILRTLESKVEIQSADLQKICKEKRQYLNARSYFASEYYQTVYYYPRVQLVESFNKLLKINLLNEKTQNIERDEKWIFHLYATGGMGKTMFARWLIARHLVPEPQRIPVARLDFDFLHLPSIQRFPWLLMLPIAEQLEGQIENLVFKDFLKKYGKYLSFLRPSEITQGDNTRAAKEAELNSITQIQIDSIFSLQFDTLGESNFDKPFVVILDTLEEMILHNKAALLTVLRQLKKIHDYYPSMRLLLSGRYNLLEKSPEFKQEFGDAVITHELQLFTDEEAARYLTENRNLNDEEVVMAIIKKCAGAQKVSGLKKGSNPFAISLFADLYEQDDVRTPEDILSCPSVELAYLIRRVILRITEIEVRWLLRYAVVPRNFTYDFFEKVVAPHIEQQLKIDENTSHGETPVDRPNNYLKDKKETSQKAWSKPEKNKSINLPETWNNLRKYASSHGFVSFEIGSENAPRLHPDVIIPMRLLLEDQEIFEPLHRDAAKYFEEKAKNPAEWEQNIREAIYHRFHYEKSGAIDFWRKQLESKQAQSSPLVRLALAEELTNTDFTDEQGFALLKSNGEPLVAEEYLYEAHLRAVEAAAASIVLFDDVKVINLRVTIQKHLDDIRRLHEKGVRPLASYRIPFDMMDFHRLSKSIENYGWSIDQVISLLRETLNTTLSDQMRLSFEIYLADILARNNKAHALEHYQKALNFHQSIKLPQVSEHAIRLRIGLWHYNQNDFEESLEIFLEALADTHGNENLAIRRQIVHHLADIYLKLGQYDEAVNLIKKIIHESGDHIFFNDLVFLSQVQAHVLYEPLTALKNIEPYLNNLKATNNAALAKFYGDVRGILMQIDESLTQYESANQIWSRDSFFTGVERVRIGRIRLNLLSIGNFHEAALLIDVWQRRSVEVDSDIAFQIRLLGVLLDHRLGERMAAQEKWQAVRSDKKLDLSARSKIRVLAAGLALGFGDKALADEFLTELRKIKTASARLTLLDIFQFGESKSFNADSEFFQELDKLLFVESREQEFIPHSILRADVFRWCGEIEKATKILNRVGAKALQIGNSYAYREILLAKDRCDANAPVKDDLLDSTFLTDFAEYPILCAAGCIEQAARVLKQRKILDCRELLLLAQERLPQTGATITELEAKLNELFAEAAMYEDNLDAAIVSFNLALAVYEKLGNRIAAARLREILPTVKQPVFSNEKFFSIRIQSTNTELRSELFYEDNLVAELNEKSEDNPLIRTIQAEPLDESSFYRLSKEFLGNTSYVSKRFREILFGQKIFNMAEQQDFQFVDINLDSFSPAAAKIPWEIIFLSKTVPRQTIRHFYRSAAHTAGNLEKIKWLQIVLKRIYDQNIFVDGIFGTETQKTFSNFKKFHGFPANIRAEDLQARLIDTIKKKKPIAPNVLAILPHREQQIRSRLFQYQRADEILSLYEINGSNVKTLWANDIHNLKMMTAEFQPDIIHLQSSFSLMPSTGQITLDFGAGDYGYAPRSDHEYESFAYQNHSDPVQLSPVFFNDALTLLPETKMRPLIVLDAVRPSGKTQTVHQLFYRNIFAAELFQLGNAAGIIAMGLAGNFQSQYAVARTLIENLLALESFGVCINKAGKVFSDDDFTDKICAQGSALFTNDPSLTIMKAESSPVSSF